MTHHNIKPGASPKMEECWIEHYQSNNCVVLKNAANKVIVLIDGEDLGVTTNTPFPEVRRRADPIFRVILQASARAYDMGLVDGSEEARLAIRRAIGC